MNNKKMKEPGSPVVQNKITTLKCKNEQRYSNSEYSPNSQESINGEFFNSEARPANNKKHMNKNLLEDSKGCYGVFDGRDFFYQVQVL
jgi:hypothetical protein